MLLVLISQQWNVPSEKEKYLPDSSNIRLVKRLRLPTPCFSITVGKRYAYLSSLRRIYVVDISQPESLFRETTISTTNFPLGLEERGGYLYAAHGYKGLSVFNVSNPNTASEITSLNLKDTAMAIVRKGNYLYVTVGDSGFAIVSVANPKRPRLVSLTKTGGFTRGISVRGRYAYVAAGRSGLKIYDVSNPRKPRLVSHLPLKFKDKDGKTVVPFAISVDVEGDIAYVALGRDGIALCDVSDVREPKLVRVAKGRGSVLNVRAINRLVYVAFGDGGISVVDPFKKVEVAYYRPPIYKGDYVFDIVVKGRYIFAASRKGMVVYEALW